MVHAYTISTSIPVKSKVLRGTLFLELNYTPSHIPHAGPDSVRRTTTVADGQDGTVKRTESEGRHFTTEDPCSLYCTYTSHLVWGPPPLVVLTTTVTRRRQDFFDVVLESPTS